jgi:catechol 2,3-dioxygenase-like lactoylglutathione lyase family enzyme
MIDHLSTYATDFPTTKSFYEVALRVLGYTVQSEMTFESAPDLPGRRACSFGPEGRSVFWVVEALESASAPHIAFAATDRRSVDAFHEAGLSAGGRDNGAPDLRPEYHEHYYGSFLTDPDGNDVEAVCHTPA